MKKMAGLKFQAQRAAFSVAADAVLKYVNKNDDRTKALLKVVDPVSSARTITLLWGKPDESSLPNIW